MLNNVFFNLIYKATHKVKFWRLQTLPLKPGDLREKKEWTCFKSFYLQSRASALKFDSDYLLASTYFLSMDLYSLADQSLIAQYTGHTCSITAFDFNGGLLNLICTGSADNSIKYWTIPQTTTKNRSSISVLPDDSLANSYLPIRTEINLLWPVKITIEKFDNDEYLVLALCANGYLFLNLILPGNFLI